MTEAAATTVRVKGAERLSSTLHACARELADLEDGNAAISRIIARDAAARAPRRTGRLAGSVRPARERGRAVVEYGGSSVPYAGPIHWGWPARGITAQPFVSEAAEAMEPEWLRAFTAEAQRALDKVKGA